MIVRGLPPPFGEGSPRVTCSTPGGGTERDHPVLDPDSGLLGVALEAGPAVPLAGPGAVVPLSADVGRPDDVSVTLPTLPEVTG